MFKMAMQQYCLRWNNHQPNFISVFSSLLHNKTLVDVTLSAEGKHLQAHKLVLSACSSYFQTLFSINPCQHPIVILKDVKFSDLRVMVDFMYYGEVNVSQDQLPHILKTAETLKIKGLAEIPVEPSMTKQQPNSAERTELLTPGDSNWSSEGAQRQSLSPSPCPLSPGSRRKRLRKSSTGSGSGSTERTSDEHPPSEVTLTSPSCTNIGTVIKPDPGGFTSESNTPQRNKQHSSDSEVHRGSSHESIDSEPPHQITLQIPQHQQQPQQHQQQPQDVSIQHNVEQSSMDMPGPSTTSAQPVPGYQWGLVDHVGFPHFSTQPNMPMTSELHYTTANLSQPNVPPEPEPNIEPKPTTSAASNSPSPQMIQKRKRSINPQADENFVRALEAVRFGGIGFCKAARMYGVNNRTLWLEYKKRGYPISRLSIKNRKQEFAPQPPTVENNSPSVANQENEPICVTNPVALISTAFLDGRSVEMGSVLQRSRYFDTSIMNSQQPINMGINFDQMS